MQAQTITDRVTETVLLEKQTCVETNVIENGI